MRIAVLAAADSWYLQDLQRAAGGKYELMRLAFSQIHSEVGGDERQDCAASAVVSDGVLLNEFDAVLVRTMPPGSLEQVVFRMDALARLEAGGATVINPPRAIETAVDKYLCSAKLHAAGLNTPRTIACQTPEVAMAAFERLGGDVVVKPLFGGEGRGITRLNDDALALRAFKMLTQFGAVIYMQQFIPHDGYDLRLFVVGEEVFAMRRRNELDWRTNISRGAIAEPFVAEELLIEVAKQAAAAIGAPLAGVDLLPARDGGLYVLEVNAVPGWKALARALDVDIAARVLDFVAAAARS